MAKPKRRPPPLPIGSAGHSHRNQVVRRLKRAHGQLGAIIQMMERDAPCRDLLTQMAAVRGAVQRAATVMLRDHVKSCVSDAYSSGRGEAAGEDVG